MTPQLQIQSVSIVLRGNFNPAIFHPSWFASYNLMRRQESDAAKIQLIHPDAAVFTAEWLEVNVIRDRFQASTAQEPYYEAVRDLVGGVFQLLTHTPLTALGVNRDFHFRLQTESEWHRVGHTLAPKEAWDDILENPGMKSLNMQGVRNDGLEGYIMVRVEPSTQIEHGVFLQINDHYQLKSGEGTTCAERVSQILAERWRMSMDRAFSIAEKIARLGEAK